jgi:hypothetical protein
VLGKVDAKRPSTHAKLATDLWSDIQTNQDLIFVEFIEGERNNPLKTYQSGVVLAPHTTSGWQDVDLSYEDKVAKHGEFVSLNWTEEGDSALRLFFIALEWWEFKLRAFEEAIYADDANAFSSGYRRTWELANANFKRKKACRIHLLTHLALAPPYVQAGADDDGDAEPFGCVGHL